MPRPLCLDSDGDLGTATVTTTGSYYAATATATTEGGTGYTASDAAGGPDADEEVVGGWTPSPGSTATDVLTLTYTIPVNADTITIYEYGYGHVTHVDVVDHDGVTHTWFSGTDTSTEETPWFTAPYSGTAGEKSPYLVEKVLVTVDGVDAEIDAVMLHGSYVSSPAVNNSAVETKYVLDGANPDKPAPLGAENVDVKMELASDGSLKTRYTWGDKVDQLLGRVEATGAIAGGYWNYTDRLGSVVGIVSETGTLVEALTYDAYGNIKTEKSGGNVYRGNYTWEGREYVATLDEYKFRARMYDARLGRFTSQDPLGFAAGDNNLVRYCMNAPTNGTDPSGLQVGLVEAPAAGAATTLGSAALPATVTFGVGFGLGYGFMRLTGFDRAIGDFFFPPFPPELKVGRKIDVVPDPRPDPEPKREPDQKGPRDKTRQEDPPQPDHVFARGFGRDLPGFRAAVLGSWPQLAVGFGNAIPQTQTPPFALTVTIPGRARPDPHSTLFGIALANMRAQLVLFNIAAAADDAGGAAARRTLGPVLRISFDALVALVEDPVAAAACPHPILVAQGRRTLIQIQTEIDRILDNP